MGYTREIAEEVLGDYNDFIGGIYPQNRISFLSYKFPPQLPKTGWLKSEAGVIIYRTGEKSGHGINARGEWRNAENWTFIKYPEFWQPATKEEVEEALINFARKQGYKNGNYECLAGNGSTHEVNEDSFYVCLDDNVWHGEEGVYYNLVFNSYTGEWAEIINAENRELKEQIEKVEKQLNELKARL